MRDKSSSRGQLRKGDRPWGGRLGDSHEPMNKNLILGRRSWVSWHNTAKPFDSTAEVNEAVVWRRTALLPWEISIARGRESGSAGAAMRWVMFEKSAEGILCARQRVNQAGGSPAHPETPG